MRVRVNDRSSAHFAAWHSPKRPAEDVGVHFQLNDARAWMRLMFWAGREEGSVPLPLGLMGLAHNIDVFQLSTCCD
jgi:hypothetical protein